MDQRFVTEQKYIFSCAVYFVTHVNIQSPKFLRFCSSNSEEFSPILANIDNKSGLKDNTSAQIIPISLLFVSPSDKKNPSVICPKPCCVSLIMPRCYYYHYFLFLLVRKCVTSIGNLDPLGNEVDDTSLFYSSDDTLHFSDLNDAGSNLAAAAEANDISFLNLDGGDQLLFDDLNGAGSDLAPDTNSPFNFNSQADDTFASDFLASDTLDSGGDSSSSSDDLSLNPLLTTEYANANTNDPSNCNSASTSASDTNQPLSRNRARNNNDDFCIKAKLPPVPREGYLTPVPSLTTDEELKRFFCPTEMFQGILNIPVCALYDDFGLFGSDIFSLELMRPLSNTQLMNVRTGKLSMWAFSFRFCSFLWFLMFFEI